MSLFRRKDSPNWWVDIRTSDGRRVQSSTGTSDKRRAQEYHDRLKAQIWDQARLGLKPRHGWREAVVRWIHEKQHKATLDDDRAHLRWLDRYLGSSRLDEIDIDMIAEITQARRQPYEIPRSKGPVEGLRPHRRPSIERLRFCGRFCTRLGTSGSGWIAAPRSQCWR